MKVNQVTSTDLESSGAPVNKLDGALGLDVCDGGVDVLWHDVTTEQQAARHVLAMAGITLHHLHTQKSRNTNNDDVEGDVHRCHCE
jgi:hypothetical protein